MATDLPPAIERRGSVASDNRYSDLVNSVVATHEAGKRLYAASGNLGLCAIEETARIADLQQWLKELDERIGKLAPNWDGDGADAPNGTAIATARTVIDLLFDFDMNPAKIMASVEGGVGISFYSGNRLGAIECLNSGSVTAITSDRTGNPEVWAVVGRIEIREALERISDYLAA